jgi:uncharacterized membrane protein
MALGGEGSVFSGFNASSLVTNEGAEILGNLTNHLASIWHLVFIIAGLVGFILTSMAVIKFLGNKRSGNNKPVGWELIAGILLINFSLTSSYLSYTLFASPQYSELSYSPSYSGPSADPTTVYMVFVASVIILMGALAIFRGIMKIRSSHNDPQNSTGAFAHITAGAFALNILLVLDIVGYSAGGSVQSTITTFTSTINNEIWK